MYRLLAAFTDGERVAIVAPLVSQGSLADVLKRNGRLNGITEQEAKAVVKQVLEGLSYLHRSGVIHASLGHGRELTSSATSKLQTCSSMAMAQCCWPILAPPTMSTILVPG